MKQFDLEEIRRTITERFNWGPSSEWTNFHFRELSKAIEESTGDRLSEETLKRIFGKRKVNTENYQPQAFSQMVLMKFATLIQDAKPEKMNSKAGMRKKIAYSASFIVLAVILVFILFRNNPKQGDYSFGCRNSADYMPFTATFEYNISEIQDSVFTDFGTDSESYLPPDRNMINFFYKNAGKYQVHFYTRARMLDSLKVFVYSSQWQGGYFPNNEPVKFLPFYDQSFFRQSDRFYASPENLKKEAVDLKDGIWTCYKHFMPFEESLDSITMKTRVFNNESTGSHLCYDINISLVADSGVVNFKFIQPKCSRYAWLHVSEKYLNGKHSDLSSLAVDMSNWLDVKMHTENFNFYLFLSDSLIYTEKYECPLGKLQGIDVSFFGTGMIDHMELINAKGQTFYNDDFSLADSSVH